MIKVNMLDAKTNFSKLIAGMENHSYDGIIIARNGKPVAQIVPIKSERSSFLGIGASKVTLPPAAVLESLDNEFFDEFEEELL